MFMDPFASKLDKALKELGESTSDPLHKRLIKSYSGDDPIQLMESELSKIFKELHES